MNALLPKFQTWLVKRYRASFHSGYWSFVDKRKRLLSFFRLSFFSPLSVKVEKSYQDLFGMACCAKPLRDIQPQKTGAPAVRNTFIPIGAHLVHIMTGCTNNGPTIRSIPLPVKKNNPVSLSCIFILKGRTQKCRRMQSKVRSMKQGFKV